MDCVDTKLFDDFRKKKLKFCTLPVKIYQNFFQRSGNKDVQKYWNRFRIRIKDTMYYSSLNGFGGRISGCIRILGWSVIYTDVPPLQLSFLHLYKTYLRLLHLHPLPLLFPA